MTLRFLALGACLLYSACTTAVDPSNSFEIELEVRNDDGEPLAGALLSRGKQKLGATDGRGLLERSIPGREGETLLASVTCPNGYEGPKAPLPVRLTKTRRVGVTGPRPTRIEATCRRTAREVVLVVRAPGGADLPILVEGIPASTVGPDGSAHLLVEVADTVRSLAVTIDTTERKDIAPKNPRRLFELDGSDALLVMEQSFRGQSRPKRTEVRDARPRRHIPTRVD